MKFQIQTTNKLSGIFPAVLRHMSTASNFSMNFFKREDKDYGILVNGSFTGSIKSLKDVSR